MGRKVDVSNLTEDEAEHVLQVVQRDMQLRKTEEERLSELKQELDQEESRCVLLSRQRGFNERCCIRCCSSFTFLLKPRRRCQDCRYNVCKRCCSYSETDKSWLCSACERSRLLKTQSLEWFYSNVRRRFKRFGSAKVLKMLYRRHVGEQASQAELTEESLYAESFCTEDSMYESDSTFYKHSEECSMAETIGVALRVAKEAIDEAIAKAERQTNNQAKQKEACYLRDNKGELIEELTTMIVQTIICRKRDLSEMQPECNLESAPDQNSNKSRSALSLLTEEMLAQQEKAESSSILCSQGEKKDDVPVPTVPSWTKNADWLENSCASSVLQSPDGNWFALQSTQPSRLSLPNNRENLMFSALDKEPGVISAYDGMVSDAESDADGDWTAAWLELHHKMSSINLLNDCQTTSAETAMKSASQITKDQTHDDPMSQIHRPSLPLLKRKVSQQHSHLSAQSLGFNINADGTESSEDDLENNSFKQTRRRRISKRENAEGKSLREFTGEALSLSETQDYGRMLVDVLLKCQNKKQGISEFLGDQTMSIDISDSLTPDILKSGTITPDDCTTEELTSTLRELTSQVNETLPTRNDHDISEDSMDEINENRENMEEDGERAERVHLKDMEVNVHQNDSREIFKIGINSAQMENPNCSSTVEQEVESDVKGHRKNDMELCESENVCVDMINNLHNSETKIATEFRENRMSVVESNDNIGLEGQVNIYIDKTHSESEESNETEKNSRLERNEEHSIHSESEQNCLISKTYKEPEAQSPLEVDEQISGERILRTIQTDSRMCEKQRQDTRNTAESEEYSENKTEKTIKTQIKRLRDYHDQFDFRKEEEVEYERMTGSVEKALDNMVEEIEEQVSNIRSTRSDATHSLSEEIEETQTQDRTEGKQTEDHTERHEVIHEKDSSHALDDETEEESCAVQGDCNDILSKNGLHSTISGQERYLSPEEIYKAVHSTETDLQFFSTLLQQKYSAASLRSITTEVLKVLNATEDLIQGSIGHSQSESQDRQVLSPSQSKKLEEQLSRLEENVYVAASAVFGLEAELGDLEQCARSISGETTEEELTHLEEQVASAAAQVQQSDLQVSDIAARIAALKSAGLNVAPQTRFAKQQTIDTSRQRRRRLPAPPMPGKKA